ncbi:MAG: 1,4-alpha-glucan branching protein GlgB [Actinomycetota bacterium]
MSAVHAGPGSSEYVLTPEDLYLFNEGTHSRLWEKLGAHVTDEGTHLAVWAPNAERVTVIGDFNGWNTEADDLSPVESSGVWSRFMPGMRPGTPYKFHIRSRWGGYRVDKADPFAFHAETPPRTGSIVWDLSYDWGDGEWMASRHGRNALSAPMSTYEVHLGSWMRGEGGRWLTYRELAERLTEHVVNMGFTHVELLPVMEHPFSGSWGYQTTGYFAPTSRFGTPQDFMALVDALHRAGIGVILDWVPSHFPSDEHGLAYFDGTHLFEHADRRRGFHPDWNTLIFNYSRHEVRSFLTSSATFWLAMYHADGLRVDAVASMLYLDYSRKEGEWLPNEYGGRENLDAITFLRQLNERVYAEFPDVQTVAEESTAWPGVSRPTDVGGLGFGLKWDMGWMHDTLQYMQQDPLFRSHHHDELTFRQVYAWHENFVLPLSHDEVVHGKGSLVRKMPGDRWQQLANLRLLLGYQYAQAGKKLLFMGGEIGQPWEWDHDGSVDWGLLRYDEHAGVQRWTADVNRVYRDIAAMHAFDVDPRGFEWIDGGNRTQSVLAFLRRGVDERDVVVFVGNFTPMTHERFRVGVPFGGRWREILNSDAERYQGSGVVNGEPLQAGSPGAHGREQSVEIRVPPLGCVFLAPDD